MSNHPNKKPVPRFLNFFITEKKFVILIALGFVLAGVSTFFGWSIAMWIGFGFAAYAAVANDSIQTIGTFIESNTDKKWWLLWLFMGLIFLATVTFSYFYYNLS